MKGTIFLLLLVLLPSAYFQTIPDPNCITYNPRGQCDMCNQFSLLTNGKCINVSNNCGTYNNQTGQCLACNNGFVLANGACTADLRGNTLQSQNSSAEAVPLSPTIGTLQGTFPPVGFAPTGLTIIKNETQSSSVELSNGTQATTTNTVLATLPSMPNVMPSTQSSFNATGAPNQLLPPAQTGISLGFAPTYQSSNNTSLTTSTTNSQTQQYSLPASNSPTLSSAYQTVLPTLGPQVQNSPNTPVQSILGSSSQIQNNITLLPLTHDQTVTQTISTSFPPQISLGAPQTNQYNYPPGFMDPYCQQYDLNKNCVKCATRFVFNNASGLCSPVSSQCNTFS